MSWTTPRSWVPGELVTATQMNQHVRDNLNAILPVGSMVFRVANVTTIETVVENRFLECNGVAVSRATYSTLFNYLNGLTPALPFGVGNGATTFNLPDLRGRGLWAQGTHATVNALGENEGVALDNRTPSHYHQTPMDATDGAQNIIRRGLTPSGTYVIGDLTGPENAPAYLVAGVWFIKYTS